MLTVDRLNIPVCEERQDGVRDLKSDFFNPSIVTLESKPKISCAVLEPFTLPQEFRKLPIFSALHCMGAKSNHRAQIRHDVLSVPGNSVCSNYLRSKPKRRCRHMLSWPHCFHFSCNLHRAGPSCCNGQTLQESLKGHPPSNGIGSFQRGCSNFEQRIKLVARFWLTYGNLHQNSYG